MKIDNLNKIKDKIENLKIKRSIDKDIQIMAVSKTREIDEINDAINNNLTLFGENRVLEAYNKFNSTEIKNKNISLHIIGHLQRNKAKKAVEIAEMIQSIDKIDILDVLENICKEKNKIIDFKHS